jgi:hypothetical protein
VPESGWNTGWQARQVNDPGMCDCAAVYLPFFATNKRNNELYEESPLCDMTERAASVINQCIF